LHLETREEEEDLPVHVVELGSIFWVLWDSLKTTIVRKSNSHRIFQ